MQRKSIIATVEVENPEWESSSFINCLAGTQKWRDFFKMPQSITIHLSGTSTDDTSNNLTNRFIASSKSHISSLYQKCKSKFFSDKISTDNDKGNIDISQLEVLLKRLQNLEDYIQNIQPSKETILLIPPKEKESLQRQNLSRFSQTRDSSKLYTIRENCSENNLQSRNQDVNSDVPSWRGSPIKYGNNCETYSEKPKIINICPACRKEYIITFDDCSRIINPGRNYIRRSNLCPACIYERPCKLSSCEIGTETYPISCGTNPKFPEQELRNILPENTLCVNYVNDTNQNTEEDPPNEETVREPSFIRKDSYRRNNSNVSTNDSPGPQYRPSLNPTNEESPVEKDTLRQPSFLRKDSYRRDNSNVNIDGSPEPQYRPSLNPTNEESPVDEDTLRQPSFLRKDSYRRNNSNVNIDDSPRPQYRPSLNSTNEESPEDEETLRQPSFIRKDSYRRNNSNVNIDDSPGLQYRPSLNPTNEESAVDEDTFRQPSFIRKDSYRRNNSIVNTDGSPGLQYRPSLNPTNEESAVDEDTFRQPSFIRKDSYRRNNSNVNIDDSPRPQYRPSLNSTNEESPVDEDTLRQPSFIRKDSYRRNNSKAYTDGSPGPQYRPSVNQSNPNDEYNREVQRLSSLYSQDDSPKIRDESIIRTRTSEVQYIDNQNNNTNEMRSSVPNNIAKSRPLSIVQETESEERYFTDENRNARMSRNSLRKSQMKGEVFNQNGARVSNISNRTNSLSYDTKPEIDRADFQRNSLPRKSQNGNRFSQTQDSMGNNRIRESMNNDVSQDMEKENVTRNSYFRRTQAENRDFSQTRESEMNNRSSSKNYDTANRNRNSNLISNNFPENTELQNDEYKPRARSVRPSSNSVFKGENQGSINEIRYVVDDNNNNSNLRNSSYRGTTAEPDEIEGAPYYNMFHKRPSTLNRELSYDYQREGPRKSGYKRTTIVDPDPSNYKRYSEVVTETVIPRSQSFANSNQDTDGIPRRSGYKRTTIVEAEPSNYNRYSEVVSETVRPGNQSFAMNDEILDIEKQFSISAPENPNVVVCQFGKGEKETTTQGKQLMYDFCSCTNDVDSDDIAPNFEVEAAKIDLSRKSSMKNPSASIMVKDCQIKCDENESQVAILSTQLEKQAEDIDDLKKIVMTCLQQMEQIKSGDLGPSQDTSYLQRKPCTAPCAPKERYLFKTGVINVKQDKAVHTNVDKMQQTNRTSNEPCSCCTCDIEKRFVEENVETNIKNCGKCVCDCKCCQEMKEVVQNMKDKEVKKRKNKKKR